jgi:hypothetical protein
LPAEALILELRRDGVDAGDLVLERGVTDDDPLEAERVGLAVERRAGALRDALQELVDVALRLRELAGRERLEDGGGGSRGLERALRVERDCRGREGEEPVGGRALELLAAEENVAEPGQDSVASSAGCVAGSASAAGAAAAASPAAGAGSASAAAISFCAAPEPTSALSFESSSSTCEAEEIWASSRSSCVWSPAVKSSSAPVDVS